MLGAMQDWDLRVTRIVDHAAREHGDREIVTHWADGSESRTTWAGVRRDALKMTQALRRLGVQPGERIATLAMNHVHHLISWYGAVGVGGVLHTINPRLFDDQLDYIANHAEDQVLLYDAAFAPLVERMKPRWSTIRHYICFDNGEFAAWIGAEDGNAEWAQGDERDPCMLCYTSGTTGNPKGVLYEHRSTMLHAITSIQPALFDFDARAVMLPVVPLV
jgi:acyl-CoA synthetase (AMP-forming)/AMP-acid ligase II